VRVVEYAVDDPGRPPGRGQSLQPGHPRDRPRGGPAAEVAALYRTLAVRVGRPRVKARQRGPWVALRSKTPEGPVRRRGATCVCLLRHPGRDEQRAGDRGVDPDRVSFTRALHEARRSVRSGLGTAIGTPAAALPDVMAETNGRPVRQRRLRAAARVVKRKMSSYRRETARAPPGRPRSTPSAAGGPGGGPSLQKLCLDA
jgi:hypothetical protein